MAYATDADLVARVPATAAIPLAQRGFALSDALSMMDDEMFGDKTVPAQVALACHFLAIRTGLLGGERGAVESVTKGGLSASFSTKDIGAEEDMSTTKWGRQYLAFCRCVPSRPMCV